jgi:hypothetical protein
MPFGLNDGMTDADSGVFDAGDKILHTVSLC